MTSTPTTPVTYTTIDGLPSAGTLSLLDEIELDQYPHSVNSSAKATLGQVMALAGPQVTPVQTVTASTTLTSADGTLRCDATGGAIVVTLPDVAASVGQLFRVLKVDSSGNTVTFTGGTVNGFTSLATQWSKATVQSNGVTWDVVSG